MYALHRLWRVTTKGEKILLVAWLISMAVILYAMYTDVSPLNIMFMFVILSGLSSILAWSLFTKKGTGL